MKRGFITKHPVLNDGITLYVDGVPLTIPFLALRPMPLIEFSLRHGLDQLWLMPELGAIDLDIERRIQGLHENDGHTWTYDYKIHSSRRDGCEVATSLVGRRARPAPTKNVAIIFLANSEWGFCGDVAQIAAAITEVETALGVPMAGSPTTVGLRYLYRIDRRNAERYFSKDADIDWEQLRAVRVPPLAWFPARDVPPRGYLHCFDRNSSHCYSAVQEDFGVGSPVYRDGGEFLARCPGLWNVEISGLEKLPLDLPPLLPNGREWLPTPLVRMAIRAGCDIQVCRALYWPHKAPIFERWGNSLWGLRTQYPEGSPQRAAFKKIMNQTVGFLRRPAGDEEKGARPDWYWTIVANERATVWYKAWLIYRKTGVAPIGAYCDALYYVSPSSEPTSVPDILDHSESLGGYKHAWTLPITAGVSSILGAQMGAAQRLALLKKEQVIL